MRPNDAGRLKPDGRGSAPTDAPPAYRLVNDRRQPIGGQLVTRWGVMLFAAARVADTAVTAPLLLAYPAGEANPLAAWIAATFGVWGYVAASLLAIPACVLVIEGLVRLDRPRGARASWNTVVVKAIAYGWLTLASAAAAVWNVHALAGVLAGVFV